MSAESWNAFFAGGTFIVIAATAIAAIVQLRHMRAGNELLMLVNLMNIWNSLEMQQRIMYVRQEIPAKLQDPAYLDLFATGRLTRADHQELLVSDFFEQIGSYVKHRLMDESTWLDVAAPQILAVWDAMEPAFRKMRERFGDSSYENFEFLAVRAQLWLQRYPDGNYPKGVARMADLRAKRT